ncbi:MAG: histidinol dehydrogenase [Kiritimatiellae bacterium]|nr:histidinol dehydrogenase [Kiritimatiellia bacterium]
MRAIPPIVRWEEPVGAAAFERFLRAPPVAPRAEALARRVLAAVRRDGDRAVTRFTARFNGVRLAPERFRVRDEEIRAARARVPASFLRAVADVLRRVRRFARAGLRASWEIRTPRGGRLGEQWVPLGRVGVYVPGGAAPLASTALMTIPLARIAGVPEVVATTPCGPDESVDPHVLVAIAEAGATEIYRLGGIQAIGALAYGTQTIRRVDKIVGPGGPFVTAAKRAVYGEVALDMVAGPSEVAVLADASARADCIAADLLSQAEHGTGHERTLLVTTSAALAREVAGELAVQGRRLRRWPKIRQVLHRRSLIVVVPDLVTGCDAINRFAPEHLEILAARPRRWLRRIRCAGAVFLGRWTPESAGDFVAGPSHVLPTGGTARFFSGLTADDFRRRMSVLELRREDLEEMWPSIDAFATVEDLPGHARSAALRLGRRSTGDGDGTAP